MVKGKIILNKMKDIASFILVIFSFLLLPLLKFNYFLDNFEFIKVLAFVCVTNVFITLVLSVSNKPIKYKLLILDKLFLALFAVMGISSLINGNALVSWFGQYYRYEGMVTMFVCLEFYWLISRLKINFEYLKKVIFLSGIVNSLFVIGQFASSNWQGRMAANLGNPNFAGAFIALSFAFSNNIWYFPLFFVATLVTGSRGALIALIIIFLGKLWLLVKSKIYFGVLVSLVLGTSLIFYPIRATSTFENRGVIWSHAIEAISKKPILGWGADNFANAFQSTVKNNEFDLKNIRVDKAHNELLEIAVGGGLLSLIIYLLINYWIIKNLKNRDLILALIGFYVVSLTNVVSLNTYLFWYFIAGLSTRKDV